MLKERIKTKLNILLPIVVALLVHYVNATDPVYSNATISDASGNSADEHATITWADLPAGDAYNAGNPSRVSAGLEPYYNLMHSFVGSVFPVDIPDSFVEILVNGTVDKITTDYSSYINVLLGYAVCVAVGLLFILIFPIVACCFCCCRCCGNCGGKMIQKDEDAENSCKRNTFAILLAIMLAFVTAGMVCIYLNNEKTTAAIEGISDTAKDNIQDIKVFVNNTVEQANHIARNNYEFLKTALLRDIDNIGYLVGIPLRTDIKSNTDIDTVISDAYALNDGKPTESGIDTDKDLTQASTDLDDVNTKLTNLNNSLNELDTALNNVKTNLDAAFTACGCTGGPDYNSRASAGVDSNQFPDLASQTQDMNDATNTNMTAQVADAEQELNDIPWRVHNDSETSRNDMKTSINNLSDDIDPMLDKIDDINDMIYGSNATVDLNEYETKIEEYAELALKYNKYRWYGGIGLASVVLLIVLLGVLGLVLGMMGGSTKIKPPERSCLSNSAGNLLIASAAFIFIFSALLMLLTTIPFMIGAPVEKIVCQTFTEPSLATMEKWVDVIYNRKEVGDGKYFLGNTFYQNSSIPLTLTGILRDCRDNKGAFEAFQLSSQFDITDILNYSKTLDVDAEIDQVNVDLSSVEIFPASLEAQLADLRAAININFTKFYEELNNSPTTSSLNALADDLDTYALTNGDATFKGVIAVETGKLRAIEAEEVAYVNGNMTELNSSVNAMETTVSGLPAKIDSIENGLNSTEQYIQNNGSVVVKSLLRDYADRLVGIADSYVTYTDTAVRTQLGSCAPIWNVYNSFMVYTFCYNLMDTFNGFWFSLGWCIFFFIPSLIFSIKFAKFLRRMDYVSEDDVPIPPKPDRSLPTPEVTDNNHKPMFQLRKNKVAHYDGTGCSPSVHQSGFGHEQSNGQTTNGTLHSSASNDHMVPVYTGIEYKNIYPDLSNKYPETYANSGNYYSNSDNENLLRPDGIYSPVGTDYQIGQGQTVTNYVLKQVDEAGIGLNQPVNSVDELKTERGNECDKLIRTEETKTNDEYDTRSENRNINSELTNFTSSDHFDQTHIEEANFVTPFEERSNNGGTDKNEHECKQSHDSHRILDDLAFNETEIQPNETATSADNNLNAIEGEEHQDLKLNESEIFTSRTLQPIDSEHITSSLKQTSTVKQINVKPIENAQITKHNIAEEMAELARV